MANRSEGNYNKQEKHSRSRGDEPGFRENLKALFTSTPHIPITPSCIKPELDYIDFYTETSETDIYSGTFRYSDFTDSVDSIETGFCVGTSDMYFHTPSLEEEISTDSTTMPIGQSTAQPLPKDSIRLRRFLIVLLLTTIAPYIGLFLIFKFAEFNRENIRNNRRYEQRHTQERANDKQEREKRIIAEQKKKINKCYNKDTRTLTLPKTEFAGSEYRFALPDVKTVLSAGVVSTIGDNAFSNCQELETVNIRCKIIGKESFKGCASLRTAIIPRNLNWVRQEAFANCPQLETVLFSTTVSQIEENIFLNSNNIREVSIPNNIRTHFFLHLSHCRKINTIYLLSLDYFKMPKSIKDAPIRFSKCKLYVPDAILEQFRNNADWSRFGQILPLSQSRWFDAKGWGKE